MSSTSNISGKPFALKPNQPASQKAPDAFLTADGAIHAKVQKILNPDRSGSGIVPSASRDSALAALTLQQARREKAKAEMDEMENDDVDEGFRSLQKTRIIDYVPDITLTKLPKIMDNYFEDAGDDELLPISDEEIEQAQSKPVEQATPKPVEQDLPKWLQKREMPLIMLQ